MWVAAVDNVCFKNLVGTYRNYGIQFADNFGDWRDGCLADGLATIEDVASYKARQVYAVTGLPCIATRTSFEIEPVPTDLNGGTALSASASLGTTPSQRSASAIFSNPRVVSGYRFNDIGMHVDYICDVLRPLSECDRVTRFRTCLCYYDGEMEIFEYGICDVDLHFSNSLRTFIPVAQAINEMLKTLELTLGLVYQKWLKARMNEVLSSGGTGSASVKLRDRVLKEGRVLPNDIIDVSAFMDSMVDVNLMDECAKELSQFFVSQKPSKLLTVATTGLVVALPMAKYLQVPVVYARKERNVVMADTYIAAYSSKTVGKNRELLVAKSHIHEDDRVLIVDDFLSSGSSQEALLRIVSQAGATAVGIGVLLEKVYDSGRQSLSGFDLPIHSLCRIASVQSGVIQLMEEEGFDLMQKEKEQQKQQLQQQQQQQQQQIQGNEPVKS
jgi:xanthine phosphoribosyltransferase